MSQSKSKVLYKTPKYNNYFKENFRTFDALLFIAEVTTHIPPKNKQYIRRYGLYSSRTRGVWGHFQHVTRLAPQGYQEKHNQVSFKEESLPETQECSVNYKKQKSTWARLIKKVYGTDLLVCPCLRVLK
jgi:hypothetical protein